jgi:hypothetical protein
MAEFQEVMRQWARMCNSVPGKSEHISICSDKESGYICPMKDCGLCNKSLSSQTDDDRLIGERIIMAWAAEHPEPVYPSIAKYLEQFGITIRRDGSLQAEFFKANEPMSADMAKLLGLQPKEVDRGT